MSIRLNIDETVFDHKRENTLIKTHGKTIAENLNYAINQDPALRNAIFDAGGALWTGILFKINGKFVHSNHLTSSVKDGDTIEVLKFTG